MSSSILPFDDIRNLVRQFSGPHAPSIDAVRTRNTILVKPAGSLGRLEEIAEWMAGWQGKEKPTIDRPFAIIFAANHGVADQGVSAYPASHTRQLLELCTAGGSASNQIAGTFGIGLKVFELALDHPTADITQQAAMDEKSAAATFAFGMEAIAGEPDLICLGEMGAGNSASAAAICTALYGGAAADWVTKDSSLDEQALARKSAAVSSALETHRNHLSDPLEIMRRLGGRETCALAGAIVAARLQNIPVVLDGYEVCAAAALLDALDSYALDHCIAGHCSGQTSAASSSRYPHKHLLEKIGLKPVLELGMQLGEASGAILAAGIIKAAIATHNEMATYDQAGINRDNVTTIAGT